ncbi:MAG: hypothetical protein FWD60_03015 [Candidatus Azobacteroides sp.]|nr:hypothetical protein [Candidatus Azobacteroides sp.]
MSEVKGVTFKKDAMGNNRYIRTDIIMQQLGVSQYPDGWENGLTSDEFLSEAKTMLRKKFDDRNKIS